MAAFVRVYRRRDPVAARRSLPEATGVPNSRPRGASRLPQLFGEDQFSLPGAAQPINLFGVANPHLFAIGTEFVKADDVRRLPERNLLGWLGISWAVGPRRGLRIRGGVIHDRDHQDQGERQTGENDHRGGWRR